MKNNYLNPPQQPDLSFIDSILAEMVIETALLNFQKEKILNEIDHSLRNNNKEDFLRLTEKLRKLQD